PAPARPRGGGRRDRCRRGRGRRRRRAGAAARRPSPVAPRTGAPAGRPRRRRRARRGVAAGRGAGAGARPSGAQPAPIDGVRPVTRWPAAGAALAVGGLTVAVTAAGAAPDVRTLVIEAGVVGWVLLAVALAWRAALLAPAMVGLGLAA